MLIKYKKPDPRAGMVCNLDEAAGQAAIDDGRASAHKEGLKAESAAASDEAGPITSESLKEQPAKRSAGRPRKE